VAVNIRHGPGSNREAVHTQPAKSESPTPLIDRCVSGEDQAWRDLHRQYHGVAARFLRRMGIPAAELDDACQEVFVQVFRYLGRFEQRADFRTWLYKLCLSQASRARRRQRVHKAMAWLLGRVPPLRPAAFEPEWSASTVTERVRQTLERLKPIHRVVLVLYEFEGVDGDEIARILRCPPATVRRRLHYARQEFEALLCAEAAEDEKS
jgi:RNA polymerase sigma-70 factor (ECF subfamily)